MQSNDRDPFCLSIHIFFNGNIYSSDCDLIITEVVKPFVELCKTNDWIDKYFFIRYSELGPHIRLRLFGKEKVLNEIVFPSFQKHYTTSFPKKLAPQIKNDGGKISNYLLIGYIPEFERYGGKHAIGIAEDFFHISSESVLSLLSNTPKLDPSTRLAKGLIAMLILLYTFSEDREIASEIMNNYHNGYLAGIARDEGIKDFYKDAFKTGFEKQSEYLSQVTENVWDALESKEEFPEPWFSYHHNLQSVKNMLYESFSNSQIDLNGMTFSKFSEVYRRIIPSYVHMMNNRLGIPITNESYLAFLLSNSLKKQFSI